MFLFPLYFSQTTIRIEINAPWVWSLSEKEKSQDDNISIQWIDLGTIDQRKAKKPYPWRLNRERKEGSDAGTKREKEEKMTTIIAPSWCNDGYLTFAE
ncbi:hypothetical protein OGZ01_32500 [Vibrio harveyi]|nr:hypothetical protein [Vibrio harveyi]